MGSLRYDGSILLHHQYILFVRVLGALGALEAWLPARACATCSVYADDHVGDADDHVGNFVK